MNSLEIFLVRFLNISAKKNINIITISVTIQTCKVGGVSVTNEGAVIMGKPSVNDSRESHTLS